MTGSARKLADLLWRRQPTRPARYALLAVAVSLTLGALVGLAYWGIVQIAGADVPPWEAGRFSPLALTVISGLVIAPLLETAGLVLFMGIAGAFTRRPWPRVLAGAVPLGLLHWVNSPATVVAGGYVLMAFSGFVVFGIVYLAWRREGFRKAFWMCAGVHALHNGVALLVAGAAALLG